MFKDKSPLGKENISHHRIINQPKGSISPIKNHSFVKQPSFTRVIEKQNNNYQLYLPPPSQLITKQVSEPLDLQCNQTLDFGVLNDQKKKMHRAPIEDDLRCQQQLNPFESQGIGNNDNILKRLQNLLNMYMQEMNEKDKRIEKLENQLLNRRNKEQDMPFSRIYSRK